MIVRQFMHWAAAACPADRAEGAGSLARAYLYAGFDLAERREAEVALTALLDDPSPTVRKAISEAFSNDPHAPMSIVIALANDQSDVAAPVLSRSPILGDDELIDCAAVGDAFAQAAIALRAQVSPALAAAIAEVGAREALIALAVNDQAAIPDFSLRRMIERFGADAELREALLARSDLQGPARSDLVAATANALKEFVIGCAWMSPERFARVEREASEKAYVKILSDSENADDWIGARQLTTHLRQAGRLTPGLILRALLSGRVWLFEASMIELTDLPEHKALALARDWRGAGFAAIYAKAGLPAKLLPAFKAALGARRDYLHSEGDARLSRAIILAAISACQDCKDGVGGMGGLLALLRRYDMEAAREEAREEARHIFAPQVEAPPVVTIMEQEDQQNQADHESAPRLITIDLDAIEAEIAFEIEQDNFYQTADLAPQELQQDLEQTELELAELEREAA